MSNIDLLIVASTMRVILERTGEPIVYHDPANGKTEVISPDLAAAVDGMLPAIIVAGEAVWREVSGKGFELNVVHDNSTLLGFRLRSIGGVTYSLMMLAAIEALSQAKRSEGIVINEFSALWHSARQAATGRRSDAAASPGMA